MMAIGIDPATNTGFAAVKFTGGKFTVEEMSVVTSTERHLLVKADEIATTVFKKCTEYGKRYSECIVCIEGYGFTRVSNIEPIFTIGTLIRHKLYKKTPYSVFIVPPTSLKKFVTGKGNSPKEVMMKETFKRWGIDTKNNNEADAVGLAMAGLAMRYTIKMPEVNMSAIKAFDKL